MTEVEHLRRRVAELEELAELNLALAEEVAHKLRKAHAQIEELKRRPVADPAQAERDALRRTAARARLGRKDLSEPARRRAVAYAVAVGVIDEFEADEMLEDSDG